MMLGGDALYSLISPVTGVFALSLGIYAYRRSHSMRAAVVFFRLTVLIMISGLLDFALMNAPDEGSARLIARILMFTMVVIFGGYLYLSSILPFERPSGWFKRHRKGYWVVVGITAMAPAMAVDQMLYTSYGWGVPNSLAMHFLSLDVLAYVSLTICMLFIVSSSTSKKVVTRQCALMAVAVAIPLIYGLMLSLLELASIVDTAPVLAPGFLVSSIIFAYGVLRHDLFVVSPVEEGDVSPSVMESMQHIDVGSDSVILVEEKRGERSYATFIHELALGYHGLLITRAFPDAIREQLRLVQTPIIWLANQPGPDRIEAIDLSILQHTVIEFARRTDKAIIMIDGLEYLISNNPMKDVLRLIYNIQDELVGTGNRLLLPLDPEAMDPIELAFFERECSVRQGHSESRGRSLEIGAPGAIRGSGFAQD